MDTQECKMKYYVARTCPQITEITTAEIFFNMYGVCVFKVEDVWTRDLYKLSKSYEEVDELTGLYGTQHFGEVRAVVKVVDEDPLSTDEMYALETVDGGRTKVELPQERIDAAVKMMKLVAKLIIEDEYDRKFLSLKAEESKIEQYLWESQVREARNLDGETPVLNSVAKSTGLEVKEVAENVLEGQNAFKAKVIALYEGMLSLKKKFKDCATIKELNVLYQDYMGVPMPEVQAIEMGLTNDVEQDGNTQPTSADVIPGLKF